MDVLGFILTFVLLTYLTGVCFAIPSMAQLSGGLGVSGWIVWLMLVCCLFYGWWQCLPMSMVGYK